MLCFDLNPPSSSEYRPPGREFNVHMSKGLADGTAVLVASSARAAVGLATKINLFNMGSGNSSAQSVKRASSSFGPLRNTSSFLRQTLALVQATTYTLGGCWRFFPACWRKAVEAEQVASGGN